MNTPAHLLINLAALGHHAPPKHQIAIVGGALLPDAPIFYFYFVEKFIRHVPEHLIWQHYFHPVWQNIIDTFNSLPFMAIGILLGFYNKSKVTILFFLSMMLHVMGDLPFHHDDAHRHFFPLSDWRFESPISYWDPQHYGYLFMPLEIGLVLCAAGLILYKDNWIGAKIITGLVLSCYAMYVAYAWMVWG